MKTATAPDETQMRHWYMSDSSTPYGCIPTNLMLHSAAGTNNRSKHDVIDALGRSSTSLRAGLGSACLATSVTATVLSQQRYNSYGEVDWSIGAGMRRRERAREAVRMKSANHMIRKGALIIAALSMLGCNAERTNTRDSTPSAVPVATITRELPSRPIATLLPGARTSETYVQISRFAITPGVSSASDVEALLGMPKAKYLVGSIQIWQYAAAPDNRFAIGNIHIDLANQRVYEIDYELPKSYTTRQVIDDLGPPGLTVLSLPNPEHNSGAPALGTYELWWPQLHLTVWIYCSGYREEECRAPSASEKRFYMSVLDDQGEAERWNARFSDSSLIRKEIPWPGLNP